MPPTRRYICSFCAKSFSRSEHKSRHERSHTNEKPFSCSVCFAKFVRRDLLQRHLRTVHNEQNPSKLINTDIPSDTAANEQDSQAQNQIRQMQEMQQRQQQSVRQVHSPSPSPAARSSPGESSPNFAGVPGSTSTTDSSPNGATGPNAANPTLTNGASNTAISSSIITSNFYSLSERNLILLLALSKKFASLSLVNGRLVQNTTDAQILPGEPEISNYLLIWGTISNIKFPVILNINKLLTLSATDDKNSVFESSLFYAVLAFGAAEFGQFSDCLALFNTCWALVCPKVGVPEDVVEPLTILAYISFNYLQDLYYYKDPQVTVSIHTIFQCLNDVLFGVVSGPKTHGSVSFSTLHYYKTHGLPVPESLQMPHVNNELFNYWYCYNLLSSYSLNFCQRPPKVHNFFLSKILPTNNDYHLLSTETQVESIKGDSKVVDINNSLDFVSNETLKDALMSLSKAPSLLRNLVSATGNLNSLTNAIFPTNAFKNLTLRENCIIMGLSNELQSLRLDDRNLFNDNKNALHNSIIMANKSLNTNNNYQQFSNEHKTESTSKDEQYSLIVNSPYSANPVKYSRKVSSFGSKSHGVHSPNEPNLNIVNNTTINSNSNYLFNVNNFSNMIINNNINQDLINVYNLIIILKKKVLINCDNKLIQDVLIDYIIIPNHETYWSLIYVTIKEFSFSNADFASWDTPDHFSGFADLIHDIMRDVPTENVVTKITKFVTTRKSSVLINNNLGLVSLPLLFIGRLIRSLSPSNLDTPESGMMNFINLNAGSLSNNNLIFLKYFLKLPKNFVNLLVEDFLILIKIFYSFKDGEQENSPIIQSIVYLLTDTGPCGKLDNRESLCYYLKQIETLFVTWLNFVNFGNSQFAKGPGENYLTRLISYVEISMSRLYEDLQNERPLKRQKTVSPIVEKRANTVDNIIRTNSIRNLIHGEQD